MHTTHSNPTPPPTGGGRDASVTYVALGYQLLPTTCDCCLCLPFLPFEGSISVESSLANSNEFVAVVTVATIGSHFLSYREETRETKIAKTGETTATTPWRRLTKTVLGYSEYVLYVRRFVYFLLRCLQPTVDRRLMCSTVLQYTFNVDGT